MLPFYTYLLIDPRDGSPFYVGKGSRINKKRVNRASEHLQKFRKWDRDSRCGKAIQGRNLHKLRKIAQIVDSGNEVKIEVIFETEVEAEALEHECSVIAEIGRENLTNLTDGGQGTSGRVKTEEERRKISEKVLKHHEENPEFWAEIVARRRGISPSEETRAKMSESQRGRKHSPETCEKKRKAGLKRKHSPETKEKISRLAKERMEDPEFRQLLSEKAKERFSDPQEREKLSRACMGRKVSSEARAKMSKSRLGKPKSEEHRRKLFENLKKARAKQAELRAQKAL